MAVVCLAVIAYTFAGFGVFWLRTGSGRIGEGGTFTPLGDLVWMAPLAAWGVAYFVIGRRGPLRALWVTPIRLTLEARGLSWRLSDGQSGASAWEDLGGVSSGVDHRARWRSVFGRDGRELMGFAAPLVDEATGRPVDLPNLVFLARPDLFEPLDLGHPGRACVRRDIGQLPETAFLVGERG